MNSYKCSLKRHFITVKPSLFVQINGLEFYGSSLPTNQNPYEHVTK